MRNAEGKLEISSMLKNTPIIPVNKARAIDIEDTELFLFACMGTIIFNTHKPPKASMLTLT